MAQRQRLFKLGQFWTLGPHLSVLNVKQHVIASLIFGQKRLENTHKNFLIVDMVFDFGDQEPKFIVQNLSRKIFLVELAYQKRDYLFYDPILLSFERTRF